jgi:hypothetical protein
MSAIAYIRAVSHASGFIWMLNNLWTNDISELSMALSVRYAFFHNNQAIPYVVNFHLILIMFAYNFSPLTKFSINFKSVNLSYYEQCPVTCLSILVSKLLTIPIWICWEKITCSSTGFEYTTLVYSHQSLHRWIKYSKSELNSTVTHQLIGTFILHI